jgi:hypothetical protein
MFRTPNFREKIKIILVLDFAKMIFIVVGSIVSM